MFNLAFAGTVPLQGSEIAARWDNLYDFLVWLSVLFFVLIVGAMIYFIFAYPHRHGKKTKYITGNHLLEGIWIGVPTLLLMVIFGWGYSIYHSMSQPPTDAYEIRVIGKQWLWTFQYDNGKTTVGEAYVPINRPVKLIMTSEDVLHSFFVPSFRVKQDVVPGMYSSIWFTATVPGKHQVFCAEYCGTSHSEMLAKLVVLTDDQWQSWSDGKTLGQIPDAVSEDLMGAMAQSDQEVHTDQVKVVSASPERVSLARQGKGVAQRAACFSCHTDTGQEKIGPSFKGLFGRQVELADGRKIVADETYILNHINNPQGNLVKGYKPVMPTFAGLISATEMNALIAYIKSVK